MILWRIGNRGKTVSLWLLLLASYVFYAWWDYRFVPLIAFVTVINWYAGVQMERAQTRRRKRIILAVTVAFTLLPLFFCKYYPWLGSYLESIIPASEQGRYAGFLSRIILPVGISFYTFQALSYSIDLYHGNCAFCPSLVKFSAFVSMFPQLVAGPIIRFTDIDAQLERIDKIRDEANYVEGMELFFRGLVKKVFFADRLGTLVDPAFAVNAHLDTGIAWASILGYSLQIYFDFSGYTDMAIGIGRCLGFSFPENFRAPYTARNPAEFWRRWHITLSTWLRDYLYIPLGGNRGNKFFTSRNLMITMLLGGLWHGAAWTFLFWGLWHGLLLLVHRLSPEDIRKKIPAWLAILLLNAGVIVGWVFFRVHTMRQAGDFLRAMCGFGVSMSYLIPWQLLWLIPIGYLFHFMERRYLDMPFRMKKIYALGFAMISAYTILELGRDTPFIYFQF
ncbi:MAG: MBOAT family protein [Sedimentisphaerales bacterium]|nr:MBOAT family protein [Sedimentisphaerales bacterium]